MFKSGFADIIIMRFRAFGKEVFVEFGYSGALICNAAYTQGRHWLYLANDSCAVYQKRTNESRVKGT